MLQMILQERRSWHTHEQRDTWLLQTNKDRHQTLREVIDDVGQLAGSSLSASLSDEDAKDILNPTHISKLHKWSATMVTEQQILKSLRFPSMDEREASISDAHSKTFRWILDSNDSTSTGQSLEPSLESRPNLKFVEWLQASDGIFWVAGKPGSGKSTLMKYLLSDCRTFHHLRIWAGDKPLHVAKYFFWSRGTEMQRSQQGLLRGLLSTILEATPGLALELCPSMATHRQAIWTTNELKVILSDLGRAQIVQRKFCFFIDGLDEYSGDTHGLVELLQQLSKSSNFKFCLSSRPWLEFEDAFGQNTNRRMNLQDLTKSDIEKYTRQRLENSMRWLPSNARELFNDIINEVVERSQGVFLWVVLVVSSLRDGLTNRDSIATLKCRLTSFPTDLEPFFETLILSVDTVYRPVMAKTFLVHLANDQYSGLPLVVHTFLEEEFDYPLKLPQRPFSVDTILNYQAQMRRRITGRYKGLLEIRNLDRKTITGYYSEYSWPVVDFLHRSVRDFLKTAPMQTLLLSELESDFNAETQLCRLHLAHLKTTPEYNNHNYQPDLFESTLQLSRSHQIRTGGCDYPMLDELRLVLMIYGIVDSDAKYLGILAVYGITGFIRRYLKGVKREPSMWLCFSPLLLLLEDNGSRQKCLSEGYTGSLSWAIAQKGSIFDDADEYFHAVQLFLDAGVDPRNDREELPSWQYLARLVTATTAATEAPGDNRVPQKLLMPLIELFMKYGASFEDLTTGDHGCAWLRDFLHALNTNSKPVRGVSVKEFLIQLYQNPVNPSQGHGSLFSSLLKEMISNPIRPEEDLWRLEIISQCLKHGANAQDPNLTTLVDGQYFSIEETEALQVLIKEASSKNRRREKKKRKRERIPWESQRKDKRSKR